jgi:hypothetical protein
MNNRYQDLAREAGLLVHNPDLMPTKLQKFAELLIQECIDKIETHRIPVGNSAAGEMACEWTYAALKEIRDEIQKHFGVEP